MQESVYSENGDGKQGRVKPLVAIIDYGMGNLRSVQKALEKAGGDARVTDSPRLLRQSQGVVLPGVGAFGEAVHRLRRQRLWGPLKETLESNKPFLGICLGYQLLFEDSQESPGVRGLGWVQGSVVRFRFPKQSANKVPHMGWNTLRINLNNPSSCLRGVPSGTYFYFVHSFYPKPDDATWVASTTVYGRPFASTIAKGALFASQFHPEKSGDQGMRILRNFVRQLKS